MSDDRMITVAAVVLGALAVVAGLSPEADRFVTKVVLALLVAGAVAGLAAHRVHVLRIRRDIEERGHTVLRRVDPPVRACERGPCRPHSCPGDRRQRSGEPEPGHRRRRGRRRPSTPG